MGYYRKYKMIKLLLQILLSLNVFLIALGIVAALRFFQNYEAQLLELVFVGSAVLIIGVLLPAYAVYCMQKKLETIKQQTLQKILSIVKELKLGTYPLHFYQDPKFWISVSLLIAEEFGKDFDHPLVRVFSELAPYFRKELNVDHTQSNNSHKP